MALGINAKSHDNALLAIKRGWMIPQNLRFVLLAVADACINTAILMCTYPIWQEFQYQRFPNNYWLRVYVSTGFLITLITFLVGIISVRISRMASVRSSVIVQIVATFCVISSLAVFADFSESNPASTWPILLQEIAAKFFSELQSIRFIVLTASLISLASGLLLYIGLPRKSERE
jgi:hypothetical protein